jgi:S1 RNA binding domain protein
MAIEVGSKLEGKVTGITNFGAFIELEPGVTGLVHISEIADNYVKDIKDFLKIADVVNVKVINIEKDGKIGLSIKQAVDKPKEERLERSDRGNRGDRGDRGDRGGRFSRGAPPKATFDDKLTRFLKDSEDRLSTLKRQTESKRGGRGARRG